MRGYFFAYDLHMDPTHTAGLGIAVHSYVPAVLRNYRLVFNVLEDVFFRFETRGLANIVPRVGSRVEGVVYKLKESDFHVLDGYYEVSSMKYYKIMVGVKTQQGKRLIAHTYAGWPDKTAANLLPREGYLARIAAAAELNGFSLEFQRWLSLHPTTY